MNQTAYHAGSIAGQTVLALRMPGFVVDGKWGRFTQSVYDAADAKTRDDVARAVFMASKLTVEELASFRRSQREAAALSQRGVQSIREAVDSAADEAGVDRDILRGFITIESNFNPTASNGSSKGLGQIQPAAWSDVKPLVPGLPSYDAGVFDPLQNARATAAYLKLNARRLRTLGFTGDLTPSVLYLAHQQGASGFMELWRTSQGLKTKTNYVTSERMSKNPPQDGKGVTTDKKDFFMRWLRAAERKIAAVS